MRTPRKPYCTMSGWTLIVLDINKSAVKIKTRFAQGSSEDKRESRTECGVLVRNECRGGGVQKNVREKSKERTVIK